MSAAYDRDPDVYHQPWPERSSEVATSELRRLPLFESLGDTELGFIAHSAYEDSAAAGEAIVRQWDPAREFYVVLGGTAGVRIAERHLADLGSGAFFGDLIHRAVRERLPGL